MPNGESLCINLLKTYINTYCRQLLKICTLITKTVIADILKLI